MKKTRQTTVYVGLNDGNTHEQRFETERYVSLLKKICQNYHVAFSMSQIDGGYFHADGSYVEEKTLALMMVDTDEETVDRIAADLCMFFNQESVMVVSSEAKVHYVEERLELDGQG